MKAVLIVANAGFAKKTLAPRRLVVSSLVVHRGSSLTTWTVGTGISILAHLEAETLITVND